MRHAWKLTQSLGLNFLNIDLLEVKDDMVMHWQVGQIYQDVSFLGGSKFSSP